MTRFSPRLRRASDEHLFHLYQTGREGALTQLYGRYYSIRFALTELLCPNSFYRFSDVMVHDAFTNAFCLVLKQYNPQRASFKTFFKKVFFHALIDELHNDEDRYNASIISLDAPLENLQNSEISDNTLHDIIPDIRSTNEPIRYVNNREIWDDLSHPEGEKAPALWTVARLVHVEGYNVREAAKKLGITEFQARYLLECYDSWARVTAHKKYRK